MAITEQVFKLQCGLNHFVFERRGLSYTRSIWAYIPRADDALGQHEHVELDTEREKWLLNFCRALDDEVREIYYAQTPKESKVEAIDILHFAVSIAVLAGVRAEPWLLFPSKGPEEFYTRRQLIFEIDNQRRKIQNELNWKWWSDYEKPDAAKVRAHVHLLFSALRNLFGFLNMTENDILSVYEQKHRVNKERQEKGYARSTKTEDDNEGIRV